MQKIEIDDDEVYEFFCPCCGTKSLGKTGIVNPCKHLLYAVVSEIPDEPEYVAEGIPDLTMKLEDLDIRDVLEEQFSEDSNLMVQLNSTFDGDPTLYLVYRIGAKE